MKTIVSEEHFSGNAACVLFRNHKIEKNAQNNTFFTAFVAILVGIVYSEMWRLLYSNFLLNKKKYFQIYYAQKYEQSKQTQKKGRLNIEYCKDKMHHTYSVKNTVCHLSRTICVWILKMNVCAV